MKPQNINVKLSLDERKIAGLADILAWAFLASSYLSLLADRASEKAEHPEILLYASVPAFAWTLWRILTRI